MTSSSSSMSCTLSDRERLQIEHEFVQNLANPSYLHYLAQHRYFEDEQFMHFLKYLEYWKQPAYMKYLVFPQCLNVLDALNTKIEFREALKHQNFRDYFHSQQGVAWSAEKWPSQQEKEDIEKTSQKMGTEGNDADSRNVDEGINIVKKERKE